VKSQLKNHYGADFFAGNGCDLVAVGGLLEKNLPSRDARAAVKAGK
jgi:hypothetical protein